MTNYRSLQTWIRKCKRNFNLTLLWYKCKCRYACTEIKSFSFFICIHIISLLKTNDPLRTNFMCFLTEWSVCIGAFCIGSCLSTRYEGMLAIKQSLSDCIPKNTCENLSWNCERKIAERDPGVLFDEIRDTRTWCTIGMWTQHQITLLIIYDLYCLY